jgi:flagellar biosynthesis protein FlhB
VKSQDEGRTEEPSGGLRERARREGLVAVSSELGVAAGLSASILSLIFGAPAAAAEAELMLKSFWGNVARAGESEWLGDAFARASAHFLRLAGLPIAAAAAGILVCGLVQTGFRSFPAALKPDFGRLRGRTGRGGGEGGREPGRIYQALFPLLRSALLLLAAAAILPGGLRHLLSGAGRGQKEVFSAILDLARDFGLCALVILLAFGLSDCFIRRKLLFDSLRLTPAQLREERRNESGDPRTRAAIRSRMRGRMAPGAVAKTGGGEKG